MDDDEAQNTTHSGSDGGGPAPAGADAKIPKKPGLSTSQSFDLWEIDIKCRARTLHEEKLELGSETNDLDLSDEIKDVYADVLEITNTFYHQLP